MNIRNFFGALLLLFSMSSFAVEVMEKTVIQDKGISEREEVNAEELCNEAAMEESDEFHGRKVERNIYILNASPLEIYRANGTIGWGAKCQLKIVIK